MSEIICVTNRKLCHEDFLVRMEKIARKKPKAIILREKDLSQEEYLHLAKEVLKICKKNDVMFVIHSFFEVAKQLKCKALHIPFSVLVTMEKEKREQYEWLGTSCHSIEEAIQAEKLGCHYIVAGHIFETDCKKGIPGRGLEFLKNVTQSVQIPVYAIGGIHKDDYSLVCNAGAKGACIMSGFMTCDNIEEILM